MKIGGIIGDIAQVVLTNTRLGLGGYPLQFFTGGKNGNFGNIFYKARIWRLTIPQIGGVWKIKNRNVSH